MNASKSDNAEKRKTIKVDLLLIGMSFIWGLNFTVIKSALDHFSPVVFNAIRFTVASLLLLLILKLKEKSVKIDREDLKKFLLLALIGNSIYQILFINGISPRQPETPRLFWLQLQSSSPYLTPSRESKK